MFNNILNVPLDIKLWYLVLFAWTIAWKGMALWKAAHKDQKWWFIGLLIVNTLGVLEILYIYVFSDGLPRHAVTDEKKEEK